VRKSLPGCFMNHLLRSAQSRTASGIYDKRVPSFTGSPRQFTKHPGMPVGVNFDDPSGLVASCLLGRFAE
jgi:hypothetical protein